MTQPHSRNYNPCRSEFPTIPAETCSANTTGNVASFIVLVLILFISIGSVFYMTYPSLRVFSSATSPYDTTETIPYQYSQLVYNASTYDYTTSSCDISTNICLCLYLTCTGYVGQVTVTNANWVAYRTTTQITVTLQSTSHWSQIAPPYTDFGSSQNSLPTVIITVAVSLIVILSYLLIVLRRKPLRQSRLNPTRSGFER
jgi:uncharacterized membrane protein YedE/YeeE